MENSYLDQGLSATPNAGGLSNEDKGYLWTAAKWARFLGIVGFVMTGFIVLAALFLMTMGSSLGSALGNRGVFGAFGAMIGVFYIVIAVVYFFISLYLFNFGKKTRLALQNENSSDLTEGLKNLKSYFSLLGIIMAILISLYALIFVVGVGGSLFTR